MQTTRSTRAVRSLALAGAAAALLAACGGGETSNAAMPGGDAGGAGAGTATVTIERSRFDPTDVTIDSGGTVEFVNLDPFDHTVTAAEDSPLEFDSGAFGQDETFTQQFDDAGTYDYFCAIHPTMRASVTVE